MTKQQFHSIFFENGTKAHELSGLYVHENLFT